MKLTPTEPAGTLLFDTDPVSSLDTIQPLVLVALLMVLFALVLWQERSRPAGPIPQTQTAGAEFPEQDVGESGCKCPDHGSLPSAVIGFRTGDMTPNSPGPCVAWSPGGFAAREN